VKGCKFCEALEKKVKTPEEWHAEHDAHGQATEEPFPHPSGDWFWLLCPCGAKYLTTRSDP
jgi:hypothetical protein